MKKLLLWTVVSVGVVLVGLGIYLGPTVSMFMRMSTLQVGPNLRVIIGGGGNTVILKSTDNKQVLIVDTKIAPTAKAIKQYVDSLGTDIRITVVNTHEHGDHIGGNKLFPAAHFIRGGNTEKSGEKENETRLSAGTEKVLAIGDETVKIHNVGAAHSADDLVVYLVNHRVLCTGDLVFNHWIPVVIKSGGAHVGKWIKALDDLLQTYPALSVVPGHGAISDMSCVTAQKEYFTSIAQAKGDPKQLAALSKKYADYSSLPGMPRVDGVAKALAEEQKQ